VSAATSSRWSTAVAVGGHGPDLGLDGSRRVVFIAVRTATTRRWLAEDLGFTCFMRTPGSVVSGMVEVAFLSVGVGRLTSRGVSWIPHLVLAASWGDAAVGENRARTSVLVDDGGV
jgi:hypothetical protein